MKEALRLVQFVWRDDDGGDYLCYRPMTAEQVTEVSVMLARAEEQGRIRSGWYVGELGVSDDAYETFRKELDDELFVKEPQP